MALLPQYTDIAGILPRLATQTGRPEHELFDAYLSALHSRTGRTTDRRQAWSEMRLQRIVRTFESLPWLITMSDDPQVEPANDAIARLRKDLADANLLGR